MLPILGLPNIERTILILNDFGINDIVIIAGIYADQYTFYKKNMVVPSYLIPIVQYLRSMGYTVLLIL